MDSGASKHSESRWPKPLRGFQDPRLGMRGRWILYSGLIGLVSGVGAIVFDLAFRLCQWGLLVQMGGFMPPASGMEGGPGYPPANPWLLPIPLVLGGLVSGILVFGLAPEAEGHGTDAVINSFHHLLGKIRRRVPPIKAIASAITIGSGGSGGREGPIAQIGAGFGSYLADSLGLRPQDRRIMMMAGVAGGIGSIFRAPLGAALFAAEVLYSEPEFEYKVLMPGLISAITGYSIYSSYAGWGYLFNVPQIQFHQPEQLLLYALLGLICVVVGLLYPAFFYGIRDRFFHRLPVPPMVRPAIGAAMLGALGVVFPQALGMGYGYIQQAIDGHFTVAFLLLFSGVKVVATSLTISSGGSGGVFGPSLVIGGSLGAAFGQIATSLVPTLAPSTPAFIMVGMGGFFAGVAKVPFASVIMVMEMTGSYGLLVPSLVVASVCYLLLPSGPLLYENQVPSRVDSPAHFGSFAVDVLRNAWIKDYWEATKEGRRTVFQGMRLDTLLNLVRESSQNMFPVVDDSERLVGEISIEDLRRAMVSGAPHQLVLAHDIMRPVADLLTLDDDLATAAKCLAARETEVITVVAGSHDRRVLGIFNRRDLILAYGERIRSMESDGS